MRMRIVRLALAALLLTGHAQARVAFAAARPALASMPALAPAISPAAALAVPSVLAPGLVAGLAAQPVPFAPAAGAARSVHAAAAAVADFRALDLGRAAPGAAREAGDALMARVLGEAAAPAAPSGVAAFATTAAGALRAPASSPPLTAPEPARRPSAPRVHLLSKPLRDTAELGPVARALHYILETGLQFVKAGLVWQATGSVSAALGLLAVELFKMPPMITAQSLADLELRYWWRKRATMKELAAVPGVTRVRVLTSGEASFSGILATRKESLGLLFVDAEGELPAEIGRFGAPIPLDDLESRRVRLTLEHGDKVSRSAWTPSLGQLLSGAAVPAFVAARWRRELDADKKGKSRLARLFDFSKGRDLRLQAALVEPDGSARELGTVAFGGGVKRLAGLGRLDRLRMLFGRAPKPRALPLSDREVR